ncbi:hypothetical protein [Cytobacillus firmus]|nr:hypothetical protein [Cytobacillus firmus]MEC1891833.1 hypothetical protein [Cytobacillus firmus]MED4767869.1 hypothetical protein [Cytobacillus firmus]SUV04265.1 catalase [Cytobacillus firmus]
MKELQAMSGEEQIPGRDAGRSKYGQGSIAENQAAKEAVEKSRETDPY